MTVQIDSNSPQSPLFEKFGFSAIGFIQLRLISIQSLYKIFRPNNFFYNVSGERAQELLLEHGKFGDFLVRPSESNKNDHTLSVQ